MLRMSAFNNFGSQQWLAGLLLSLPAVLWALSFHEFCHGWVAYRMGDRTAAHQGRLSLNPLDHLDPIGTLMLILFRFGWAKPVPINSRYFKNPRRGIVLVSLAGSGGNFLTALVCGVLINLFPDLFLGHWALREFMINMLWINVGLGVFNLIPIPPLDGSKVLAMFLPPRAMNGFFFLERYGMPIILILVVFGVIQAIMTPISLFLVNLFLFRF